MTFVKGQSGNPRGRPRKTDTVLTLSIKRLLMEKDAAGRPNKEAIAAALISRARAGEIEAIKVVLDRVDGKLVTPVEHSGGESPIQVEVVYADEGRP